MGPFDSSSRNMVEESEKSRSSPPYSFEENKLNPDFSCKEQIDYGKKNGMYD